MLVRAAFFEGAIQPGREAEFDAYVAQKLAPLWRQFPHAFRVDILREVEADEGAHRYPLVLQISYPNRAALDEALASSIRSLSREVTRGLFETFDGRVWHAVYLSADS